MDDKSWLERVQDERRELCVRLAKLDKFLERIEEGRVRIENQPRQYALLQMQCEVMRQYIRVLNRRIEIANSPEYITSDIAEALWR